MIHYLFEAFLSIFCHFLHFHLHLFEAEILLVRRVEGSECTLLFAFGVVGQLELVSICAHDFEVFAFEVHKGKDFIGVCIDKVSEDVAYILNWVVLMEVLLEADIFLDLLVVHALYIST